MRRSLCPHCRTRLEQGQRIHPECVDGYADAREAKAKRTEVKKLRHEQARERAEIRERKAALRPRGEFLKAAKVALQALRRHEELAKGRGCMSCGRSREEVEGTDGWKPGGAWDGGHFVSKGARPELALEPLNIWLQCKSCNGGSGKYARKGYTVNASFEANLIEAMGAEFVAWLKGPHEPKHYTTEELKELTSTYRRKLRELKARTE